VRADRSTHSQTQIAQLQLTLDTLLHSVPARRLIRRACVRSLASTRICIHSFFCVATGNALFCLFFLLLLTSYIRGACFFNLSPISPPNF
jgi:hypothetical protein